MTSKDKLPWHNSKIPDDERVRLREERVLELTLPPFMKSKNDIANMMNISITQVWRIQTELVAKGKLERDPTTGNRIKQELPEKQLNSFRQILQTEFAELKAVKTMILRLQKDKVSSYQSIISYLWKFCKTVDCHPNALLGNELDVDQLVELFKQKFARGETVYINQENKMKYRSREETTPNHYIQSVKTLRRTNGVVSSRGFLAETNDSEDYSDIHLSDLERVKGIEFMTQRGDKFRKMFVMQFELGPRIETLVSMKPTFLRKTIDVDGNQCEYFTLKVYESKQESDFEKVIMTKEARDYARNHVSNKALIEGENDWELKRDYNQHLREFYQSLGKLPMPNGEAPTFEKGTEAYYLNLMPSHVLRKSWTHWMLRSTKGDITFIASLGWNQIETMLKHYAKRSVDAILHQDSCNYCKPSKFPDENYQYFDSLNHAIGYHNGLRKLENGEIKQID